MGYITLFFFAFIVSLIVFIYQLLIRSRVKLLTKVIFGIALTFSIMLGAYIGEKGFPSGSVESKILSPIGAPIAKGISTIRGAVSSKEIEKIVQEEIENENGTYAVAIKNIKTGENYFFNENEEFGSASLYKLWVMGEVFRQTEKGTITIKTRLSDSIPALNERFGLASESAELKEGDISMTIENALEQMITVSANYPAYLLTTKLKSSNIRNFMDEYNFSDSSLGTANSEPATTAMDIFKYFELLYNKKLVSQSSSTQMLEILKRQEINDRIPKYLPENIEIAHKTGELFGNKHNAGIVYSPKGDYIIVLMSKTNSEKNAAEVEAQISKRVWEYFNK